MVGDSKEGHAKGDAITDYIIKNWDVFQIEGLIWKQRLMGYGGPVGRWVAMQSRGDRTQDHFDHPHVFIQKNASVRSFVDTLGGADPEGKVETGVGAAADAAVDTVRGMTEAVSTGVAMGLVRSLKYAYGYTVLRPIDFMGGFSYEFINGIVKDYRLKDFRALTRKDEKAEETPAIAKDERLGRFWPIMFASLTYYLAFGRAQDGKNMLESAVDTVGNAAAYPVSTRGARQPARVGVRLKIKDKAVARKVTKGKIERVGLDGVKTEREGAKRVGTATTKAGKRTATGLQKQGAKRSGTGTAAKARPSGDREVGGKENDGADRRSASVEVPESRAARTAERR
jgi:hypothetical protein